ncbi:MAG: Amuc_1099 family pilus-like system protein [Lentisphaeria bacterium]
MAFLARHYEKLVLGVLLVAVLGWSCVLLGTISQTGQQMQEMRQRIGSGPEDTQPLQPLDKSAFPGTEAVLGASATDWQPRGDLVQGTLFDTARYIYCANANCAHILPFSVAVCPYCKAEQGPEKTVEATSADMDSDGDGLSDAYENKYKFLDRNNPGDAGMDEDNDGFSNLEESLANTSPTDPAVHPPYAAKLRFIKAARSPLPVTLERITRSGEDVKNWTIQFAVQEGNRRLSRFARVGETVGGFTVIELRPKTVTRTDATVKSSFEEDVSEVTLRRGQEEAVVLVRGQQKFEKGVKAELVFLPDLAAGRRDTALRTVAVGEKFTLTVAPDRKETYVLTKVSDRDAAVAPVLPGGDLGPEIKVQPYRRGADVRRPRGVAPGRGRGPSGALPGMPPGMMVPPGMMPPGAVPRR